MTLYESAPNLGPHRSGATYSTDVTTIMNRTEFQIDDDLHIEILEDFHAGECIL